jgi:hypothetical protein
MAARSDKTNNCMSLDAVSDLDCLLYEVDNCNEDAVLIACPTIMQHFATAEMGGGAWDSDHLSPAS